MERQKVVHFAKTRTARVLRPGCKTHPMSSQAMVSSDPSPAPLASIDSDFMVITKRRDETNMAPDLWDHIRKSVPPANFYLQADSGIFDQVDSYTEQDNYIPPRTYIKLRSTQSLRNHSDATGLKNDKKLNSKGVRQHLPREHLPQEHLPQQQLPQQHLPQHHLPQQHLSTNSDKGQSSTLSDCVYNTQNVIFGEYISQEECPCPQKLSVVTDACKSSASLYRVNNHTDENTTPKIASKTLAQIEPAPSKVFLKLPLHNCSKPSRVCEPGCLDSPSSVKSSPGPKLGHVSRTSGSNNYLKQFDIIAQSNSKENEDVHKLGLNYSKPDGVSEHSQSERDITRFDISRVEDRRSVLLPEMLLPFNYRESEDDDPLPEMYSISPSAYTSSIRLASERLSRTFTNQTHTNQPQANQTHTNQTHKNRTYESKGFSNNPSVCIQSNVCSSVHDIKKCEENDHVENTSCFQAQECKDKLRAQTLKHHDCTSVEKQRPPSADHCTLVPESMFSWKRNSLKLATHGYLSISDLADSLECLASETQGLTITDSPSHLNRNLHIGKDVHSGNFLYGQESILARNGISSLDGSLKHVTKSNSLEEGLNATDATDFSISRQHKNCKETNSFKRLPLKLVTSGIGDVWLLETDPRHLSDTNNIQRISANRTRSGNTQAAYRCQDTQHRVEEASLTSQRKDCGVTSSVQDKSLSLDRHAQEEKLRKLKRRSFMLATRSMSDLTLLDDSVQYEHLPSGQHLDTSDQMDFMDLSNESVNSNSFHTPESSLRRLKNGSVSNSLLNSSFGSFYSCRSFDFPKTHPSKNISVTGDKVQPNHNKAKIDFPLRYGPKALTGSADSDSCRSFDTSVYYAASENSCLISDVNSNHSPYLSHTTQRSRTLPLPGQWRKSPGNHSQMHLQSKADQHLGSRKSNTFPYRSQTTKPSYPATMFQCYGCGVDDKLSFQTKHPRRKNNSRTVLNRSRVWVNPEYVHSQARQDRRRSRSVPSSRRTQSRHSDAPTKPLFPVGTQHSTEPNTSSNNLSSSSRIKGPTSSGPIILDPNWQSMPRIPPSLGRPRRKLYAGFDSQPLPMDSFLSDSSSVYSTQSCSSWSTSRSATTESISRTSDVPSKARSASSIASCVITPTNHVTQDEVFDFFTYTNKRSSACENNHNLYLNSELSCADDCFKDSFYDKAYSKESLESFLSDGTTVNIEHILSPEGSLDYVTPLPNSAPDSIDVYNSGQAPDNGKLANDKYHLDRLNNCYGSESELQLGRNNQITSTRLERNQNQLNTLKASLSPSPTKSKSLSKRKYFSCKDILDLVMTSEKNYKHAKGRSRSLERQAQKMCEVILCLN